MLAPLVLAAEISAANLSPSTAATAPIEEAATERGFGCSLSGCGTYNQYTGEWSGTNWKGEHAAGNTYTGQWHANGWEGSATGNTHTGNYAATGWQGSIAGNGYSGGYVAQDNWGRTHYGNSHYGPYYLVKEKASGLVADHAVFAAVGAAAALFVAVGLLRRARNISLQHPVAGVTPAPLSLV